MTTKLKLKKTVANSWQLRPNHEKIIQDILLTPSASFNHFEHKNFEIEESEYVADPKLRITARDAFRILLDLKRFFQWHSKIEKLSGAHSILMISAGWQILNKFSPKYQISMPNKY